MLELRKTGVINVTKDVTGKGTDVRLIVTSYKLVLDDETKALNTMDGKKVKVTGTFSMEEGKRLFHVKSFEVIKTKETDADKKPAEKPAKKPAAK